MSGGSVRAVQARARADRIVAARVRGDSVIEIARAEGIARTSVHKILAREMERRRSAPDATTEAARAMAIARVESLLRHVTARIETEIEEGGVISRDSVAMHTQLIDRMSKLAGLDTPVQQDHRITVDGAQDVALADRILATDG